MDLSELRRATLQGLAAAGVNPPLHLPLLDEPKLRHSEAAIDRLFCLNAVAAAAYGFPKERTIAWLERESLWSKLEGDEESFLISSTGETALLQWQVEGIFILAWALGILENLDIWKPCPDDLVFKLPNLKASEPTGELRGALSLRPVTEIAAAADLAYCLHWAVRDARLNGGLAPGGLEELDVMERRRALDWLLGDEDWYSVSLDT